MGRCVRTTSDRTFLFRNAAGGIIICRWNRSKCSRWYVVYPFTELHFPTLGSPHRISLRRVLSVDIPAFRILSGPPLLLHCYNRESCNYRWTKINIWILDPALFFLSSIFKRFSQESNWLWVSQRKRNIFCFYFQKKKKKLNHLFIAPRGIQCKWILNDLFLFGMNNF